MRILDKSVSSDGATKYLLGFDDGLRVESVFLQFATLGRDSICISSQVGCPYSCRFCATGTVGYARNLSAEEMVEQALTVFDDVNFVQRRHFEFSFMGMGEPMLNFEAVIKAKELMKNRYPDFQYCISTVGVTPKIMELAERSPDFSLQVSLHAPTDDLRTRVIPTNKVYPIAELLDAAHHYADVSGQLVQLNYCLMRGFNDSLEQASDLADIVLGRPFLVKLVNFNPHESLEFQPTTDDQLSEFLEFLRQRGVNAISRPQLGTVEGAGCGQLDANYASQELRKAARA